jgi:hypothetical protein
MLLRDNIYDYVYLLHYIFPSFWMSNLVADFKDLPTKVHFAILFF